MPDIVNTIKDQYARFLDVQDWEDFKFMAEYYLRTATKLKIKHIFKTPGTNRPARKKLLRIRNAQKRLFIGIGCELLIKAIYLKEGYCIHKPMNTKKDSITSIPTHKIDEIDRTKFNHRDTFTFDILINHLKTVHQFKDHDRVVRALKIAMTFRNKEGHVTFPMHEFDPQNYVDIQDALCQIFDEAFGLKLTIKISMKPKEKGIFEFL